MLSALLLGPEGLVILAWAGVTIIVPLTTSLYKYKGIAARICFALAALSALISILVVADYIASAELFSDVCAYHFGNYIFSVENGVAFSCAEKYALKSTPLTGHPFAGIYGSAILYTALALAVVGLVHSTALVVNVCYTATKRQLQARL